MKSGFIITSIMNKEDKAFKEFNDKIGNIFNAPVQCYNCNSNFQKLLSQEIRNLKTKKNFRLLEKYQSILFIDNNTSKKPSEILEYCRNCQISFRNILRIIPLNIIIKFEIQTIQKFILENPFEGTYKILYEGRLCPNDLKERIFQAIVPIISSKVKLNNPDYVIVVEGFKSFVGISVIKNDTKNFNFSIHSI